MSSNNICLGPLVLWLTSQARQQWTFIATYDDTIHDWVCKCLLYQNYVIFMLFLVGIHDDWYLKQGTQAGLRKEAFVLLSPWQCSKAIWCMILFLFKQQVHSNTCSHITIDPTCHCLSRGRWSYKHRQHDHASSSIHQLCPCISVIKPSPFHFLDSQLSWLNVFWPAIQMKLSFAHGSVDVFA